jgi:metal-sulfur cluster biosynthetic enzyme
MDVASIELKHRITEGLKQVIDPETNVDVVRMRLIEDLQVDSDTGCVRYKFRPSSPLCPLAVTLVLNIREAVARVPGVMEQEIEVVGYVGAEELNAMLRKEAEGESDVPSYGLPG